MYRASDVTRLPLRGEDWDAWRAQNDHLVAPLEIAP
jgi:hypothetical protein